MARVIRVRSKPKNWSPGVFAGAAVVFAYFKWTNTVTWWIVLIALIVIPIVDILLSGTTKTTNTEITRE